MNLRILKKLSKRAAPYLPLIGDTREQFRAVAGDNYHGMLIRDMNKLERMGSPHTDVISKCTHVGTLTPKCRVGTERPYLKLYLPGHPLKGTVLVGGMSCGEQPEWDEECAWRALREAVYWHFTEYDPVYETLEPTRSYRNPGDIFRAADEIIRERQERADQ